MLSLRIPKNDVIVGLIIAKELEDAFTKLRKNIREGKWPFRWHIYHTEIF
jgi:hypothetical protein